MCLCKVNGHGYDAPVDQEAYNACIAEEKAKHTQKTPEVKQAELEEKVKNLEEKTETVAEKVETVVEKVEKVVEKKMTQEEAQAYAELKEKAAIIDGLFEAIKKPAVSPKKLPSCPNCRLTDTGFSITPAC